MTNFGILNNENVIINVVVGESLDSITQILNTNCVEIPQDSEVWLDWSWDGTTFTSPVIKEVTND
jgi:hypothetical protein